MATALALAAPPPRDELGRVRTLGGVTGPDWGLWGDLSANVGQRVAVRAGSSAHLPTPDLRAQVLLEVQVGSYGLHGFGAAGPGVRLDLEPLGLVPLARGELGLRALIRWGLSVQLAAGAVGPAPGAPGSIEDVQLDGRLGGVLEW